VAIAWSNVTDVAPELATGVPTALQVALVALANDEIDDDVLEARADLARAYYAAHFATLAKRGDVSGTVVGESVGDISTQYGNNSPVGSDPLFDTTSYGKAFKLLAKHAPLARIGHVLA
jgi:hypothetical protein